MDKKICLVIGLFIFGAMGCGGGDGVTGSSGGTDTGTTTGQASTSTLSSVPSVDISNIDYTTTSSSSSSLSALTEDSDASALVLEGTKSATGLAGNFNAVGSSSRAGCEANMHKKEIKRHSKEAALDFCYARAMEKAKLASVPQDGSFAFYSVVPPKDNGDNTKKACDGIPKDHVEEIANCKKGNDDGPGSGGMKLRIGRPATSTGTELQMDICEGKTATLVNESTYGANGSKYTVKAVRIGSFNGHTDKSSFSGVIDLGTTGKVTDSIPDLGDGTATATSVMDGGFGSGTITFAADGKGKAVTIDGSFNGKFKEQRTGLETSFTGKAHAVGDNGTGCAKFSFSGAPPVNPLKDMVPFDIPDSQLDNFLGNFGQLLGLSLTKDNYKTVVLCPNPKFNPEDPSSTSSVPPQVVAGSTGCTTQTHTGVECYAVTNTEQTGQFSQKEIKQVFTIIDNSKSAFFKAVNAFDLATLTSGTGTVAFSRNWNCQPDTGKSFTELDFSKFTQEQAEAAKAAMQDCFKLEEEAHGDNGMGDHNCNEQQQKGSMNNFAKNGPPKQGNFGGACQRTATTCSPQGRQTFFFNPKDPDKNQYCLVAQDGCKDFTITGTGATGLSLTDPDGSTVTAISFTQSGTTPATAAHLTLTVGGASCTADCTLTQPKSFDKPTDFDPKAAPPTGGKQGQTGFVPKPCIGPDGKPITPEKCHALCEGNPECSRRD